MISILIATKDRPEKLANCLHSILKNSYKNYEVLIGDQSQDEKTQKVVSRYRGVLNIKFYRFNFKGKSKVLNFLLNESKGNILAFTDDDCIVDKNWLENINQFFQDNKSVKAVFGRVLPYKRTFKKGYICPSITTRREYRCFSKPCVVHKELGVGNNFSAGKEIVERYGFKRWLGVGTFCGSGEEDDLVLNLLAHGCKVAYEPKIKVWHDRWINKSEFKSLVNKYNVGTYACYTYHYMKGIRLKDFYYLNVFFRSFKICLRDIIKKILSFKANEQDLGVLVDFIKEKKYVLLGYFLGYYHFFVDSLNKKLKELFLRGVNIY